jgi:hypothetical protein
MDKSLGVMQRFAASISKSQTTRTLKNDRTSVDRQLRLQGVDRGHSDVTSETDSIKFRAA